MNSTNQAHFSPRGTHDSYVFLEVTLQHNRYHAANVCFVIGPSRGGACLATSPIKTSKRQMSQMPNSDPKCLCGQEKTMSLGAGAARGQVYEAHPHVQRGCSFAHWRACCRRI